MKALINIFLAILLAFFSLTIVSAQNIVITDNDTYTAEESAMLDVMSTTKGMLVPRLTTSQRNAIANKATGLLVFDTTVGSFYFYDGVQWVNLTSGNASGILGYTAPDKVYLNDVNDKFGIGTTSPMNKLDVKADLNNGIDQAIFNVVNQDGDTIFAVYPYGVRIYVLDEPTQSRSSTTKGGFAVGGYNRGVRGLTNEYLRVTPDSVRIYIEEGDISRSSTTKGGFAVGGYNRGVRSSVSDYFNIYGSNNADTINSEARIFWYPLKEAFLCGRVLVESPDSVGTNSFASGYNSKSIGEFSQALGFNARAFGGNSTAIGNFANAEADNSYAIGDSAKATGTGSYAIGSIGRDENGISTGNPTIASGNYSFSFGNGGDAQGLGSIVLGTNNIAGGNYSLAMGYGSFANGAFSTSIGRENITSGVNSIAIGTQNESIGNNCVSLGFDNLSDGYISLAMGVLTTSSGYYSTSFGYQSKALGWYSTSMGNNTTASGTSSTAMGDNTTASGSFSSSMGRETEASSSCAVAMGNYTTASGLYSFSMGDNTIASGSRSTALGTFSTAQSYASVVLGRYNVVSGSLTSWVTTDPLFVIGNGTSTTARNNALTVYKNGNLEISGSANLNKGISSGIALKVNGVEALWFNGTYFSWGYGGSNNYFADAVGIGVTSPTYKLELPNASAVGSGQARAYAWVTYSDSRVKLEQQPLIYGLNDVLKLAPKQYEHYESEFSEGQLKLGKGHKKTIGLIAQEVYNIIPEAVFKPEDESADLWSIDYEKLTPVLIQAIKEQQEQINQLKEALYKNEIENKELKASIERINHLLEKSTK